jgi:molybdopterin synthase catalytic subunit
VESVAVRITDGPLVEDPPSRPVSNAGAMVWFDGVVRPEEGGRPISALDYEAYQPMAETQLRRLAEEMLRRHGLLHMYVEHSRGRVPAGACSFRLRIASRHRPEALRAAEEFIDRMKRDVPIWKTAVFAE